MYKKRVIKNDLSVLSLIVFYDINKILMYKVIGLVVYTIIDDYICLDYLGFLQERLSKHDNNFENTKFKNLYALRIPKILMNIISCHVFAKYSILEVILTCWNDLVPYYIFKRFVVVETEVGEVDNIPIPAKNKALLIMYMKRRAF